MDLFTDITNYQQFFVLFILSQKKKTINQFVMPNVHKNPLQTHKDMRPQASLFLPSVASLVYISLQKLASLGSHIFTRSPV